MARCLLEKEYCEGKEVLEISEMKVTVWRAAKHTECGSESMSSSRQQKPDEVMGKRKEGKRSHCQEKPAMHLLERQLLPLE